MSDMGSSGFFCVISVVIYTYFLYIKLTDDTLLFRPSWQTTI